MCSWHLCQRLLSLHSEKSSPAHCVSSEEYDNLALLSISSTSMSESRANLVCVRIASAAVLPEKVGKGLSSLTNRMSSTLGKIEESASCSAAVSRNGGAVVFMSDPDVDIEKGEANMLSGRGWLVCSC